MRLTGLGLFVLALAHYLIPHLLYDPAEQNAEWIDESAGAALPGARFDWLMLMFVLFHAFMGMRTVVGDYTSGGAADGADDAPVPRRDRAVRHRHDRRRDAARRPVRP